jgi:autotransporter-associated beta strand protein
VASASSTNDVPDIALGSITFSASHTVDGSGLVELAAGIINTNGVGDLVLNNPMVLTGDQTFSAVSPATIAVAGLIGPGALVIQDDTTVTLNATGNTLPAISFGGTASGTLRLNAYQALSTVTLTLPADATLDLAGFSTEIAGLNGSGTVLLGPPVGQVFTINNAAASVFTGTISGFGDLVKTGAGELTLGGANAYSGQTFVMEGTLRVAHDEALGAMNGNQGTGTVVVAGATLILAQVSIGNEAIALGDITGPSTLRVDGPGPSSVAGGVAMYDGRVTGTGGVMLTLSGLTITHSTLEVTGVALRVTQSPSALTAATTIGANGTLSLGANNLLSPASAIALTGGTLALDGHRAVAAAVTGSGTVALGANGTLTLAMVTDSTFSAMTTGTGTIEKTGQGTLIFPQPTALNGSLLVYGGRVVIGHGQAFLTTNIEVGSSAALV